MAGGTEKLLDFISFLPQAAVSKLASSRYNTSEQSEYLNIVSTPEVVYMCILQCYISIFFSHSEQVLFDHLTPLTIVF